MSKNLLFGLQIIVGLILLGLFMIQGKGGGLSSSVGSLVGVYRSRRGLEKLVFSLTIILSAIFFGLTLLLFWL